MIVSLVLAGLGLVLGSFVNAFVWRLRKKKDWVRARSECTHCHHILAPRDLVPVFSWLALGGRCRYCHKPIEDSPLVELALAALFVTSYHFWPYALSGEGLMLFYFWLLFLVGFVVLGLYDIRWFLLPDKVVFPLIGLAIAQLLAQILFFDAGAAVILGAAAGVLIISGLFYALFLISRGHWIGFGDVKLGIVLGILAGGALEAVLLLFMASLLGMLYSLPLVLLGRAQRKTHVPFGPFLLGAMIIVQLFGADILDWYQQLLV